MGKLSSMTSPTPALMNDRLSATPTAAAGGTPPAESADLALPRGLRLGAFEIQRVLARSASSIGQPVAKPCAAVMTAQAPANSAIPPRSPSVSSR